MTARPTALHASVALGLLAALFASAAEAQQAEVTMQGRCEKLVIADQDVSQSCKETIVNSVAGRRVSFDFSAEDGQTLSFSGTGLQQEATEVTDPLQPISLVVPGRKDKDSIVRIPAPAVGACRFTKPEPGKTLISCEVTSQGKLYAGTFLTDSKSAAPTP